MQNPRLASFYHFITIAVLALLFSSSMRAQVSAELSGTVLDPTGTGVPEAQLILRSAEQGWERVGVTDAQGAFDFPGLQIGQMELRVRKPGFQEEVRRGVQLSIGQRASVNLTLQLGSESQQVTVNENATVLSVSPADTSGVVRDAEIKNLPLNGRSYDLLLTLNPGVVNYTSAKTGGVGVSNSTVGNNFAVAGNRPQQNLFLLNGVEFTGAAENNMQPGGTSQLLLGVDAVREFNVLRSTYGAEYGKRPGAQVVIATDSGTNQVHGSLYEFFRNNVFDARNFFDGEDVPGFQRNQFGGALGGPIQKDQWFGFVNFEGLVQHLHQTGVDLVPDLNARNGYLPCKIVTPAPTTCPASGLVFVGVSPLISAWPEPTAGAPDYGGISEALNSPLQTIRDDFGTARVDRVFSSKDTLNGVYTVDDSADFTPTSTNLYSTDVESLREQVASLSETHVFSARLLNRATAGYSRASYFFTGEPTPGTPAASLPGFLSDRPIGALVIGGSAASNPTAQLSLAGSNNGSNLFVHRNLFTYEDQLSWDSGRHHFTGGVWLQRVQSNEILGLSQYGQATFTSLQTLLTGVASSLLYDPAPSELGWRAYLGAWYATDVIRFGPRFNLSLGFRGESSSGWNEVSGRAANYTYPGGVIASQPTVSDSAFTVNRAKFLPQPRIGLAWTPFARDRRTVVHAGFGMYNDLQDALGYRTDQNAPFNPTYSLPNAHVSAFPLSTSAPIPSTAKLVPGGVQPDLQTPTLLSWSIRIEREISANTVFGIGYVGSHGYHELLGIDANQPFPVICPASPCPSVFPSTFPTGLAGTVVPAGTYYVPTAVRANPAIANTWTYFSEADSSYNALQLDFNRRWTKGVSVRGTYTWAKTIDDGDSLNATTSGGEPALASNPFNLRADRGLANFDVRYLGVINALYALPIGRGRTFWNGGWPVMGALISGWDLSSIVTLQSGFPFTPQLSYNPSNNGDTRNPVRPFVNPNFKGSAILGTPQQWFNPAAFLQPPPNSGLYGDLGRDTLEGPGLATWDISLLKTTKISEQSTLQFRAEVFNCLNKTNFNTPNAIVFTPTGVSPTAGVITATATSSRQIQLGLKLAW